MTNKRNIRQLRYLLIFPIILVFLPATPRTASSISFLRQLLTPKNGLVLRSFFTPKDDIRRTLVELIKNESKYVKVAIYFLTDENIATALAQAKKRGIVVEIVTDPTHLEKCPHTKIFDLHNGGVKVGVFKKSKKDGIMHNKFAIFGNNINKRSLIATGSFNYTNAAQNRNKENILITNEESVVNSYEKEFAYLQKNSQTVREFLQTQRMKN